MEPSDVILLRTISGFCDRKLVAVPNSLDDYLCCALLSRILQVFDYLVHVR